MPNNSRDEGEFIRISTEFKETLASVRQESAGRDEVIAARVFTRLRADGRRYFISDIERGAIQRIMLRHGKLIAAMPPGETAGAERSAALFRAVTGS